MLTTIAAAVTSIGIAAFAIADIQSVITDGENNYLSFLGESYDEIKISFYFSSYMFNYAGQFAQPGWGKQTEGKDNAPRNGYKYGRYTKITPNGNDVTIYNGKGQSIYRYDFSHDHAGIQPHIHKFNWWIYDQEWRWNGKNGKVFPF